MTRLAPLLLAGFLAGFSLAACGPTAPSCTPASCGGCCDAAGKCQSGTSNASCGVNGATCGRCGTGTVCSLGECTVGAQIGGGSGGSGGGTGAGGGGGTNTGGGGGGSTGGSGGGGFGGGFTGCQQLGGISTLQANLVTAEYRSFSQSVGHYNVAVWGLPPLSGTGFDGFRVEVVYPGDQFPSFPLTTTFQNQGYQRCQVCAIYNANCDQTGVCAKQYLAQSGSVTISRADRNAAAGRLAGSASNVRFNEWNLETDTAVAGGGCVIISGIGPWDVGWPPDGGAPP